MPASPTPGPPRRTANAAHLRQRLDAEVVAYGRRRGIEAGWDGLPDRLLDVSVSAAAKLRAVEENADVPGVTPADLVSLAAREIAALSADDAGCAVEIRPALAVDRSTAPGTWLRWVLVGDAVAQRESGVLVAVRRDSVVLRLAGRLLTHRSRARLVVVSSEAPRPTDADLHARRAWFDLFRLEWPGLRPMSSIGALQGHPALFHWYTCACCGYPTRRPSASNAGGTGVPVARDARACLLCGWSDAEGLDDGQEEQASSANGAYRLPEARASFAASGSMFDAEDESWLARRHRKGSVRRRKARVRALFDGMARVADDGLEVVDAWRGAFALLDKFDGRMESPVGTCPVAPPVPASRGRGALGRGLDHLLGGFSR